MSSADHTTTETSMTKFETISITFTNLTTNTSHTILVGGATQKVAHLNYLAARRELVNPLFEVTECHWVD